MMTTIEEFLDLVRWGCRRTCSYDEAEGDILNHCSTCQTKITQLAYQIFISLDPEDAVRFNFLMDNPGTMSNLRYQKRSDRREWIDKQRKKK